MRNAWFVFACAVLLIFCGCVKTDEEKAREAYQRSINAWAKPFGVVASGQGVAGSAPYTPGNSVTILVINLNSLDNEWYYGSYVDDDLIPAEWVPGNSTEVQLVLIEHATSEDAGYYFYHWKCNYELREALTGQLIDSAEFEGDNHDPEPYLVRTVNGAPVGESDKASMVQPIRGWLAGYL